MFGFRRKKEKPLRQQLLEARADLARQLQVMNTSGMGAGGGLPDNRSIEKTISDEIQEIDAALANLKDDDA